MTLVASAPLLASSSLSQQDALPASAWWVSPFCGFAFLFFQGALTHLFGGDDALGSAPLQGLFTPIALAIQLLTIALLSRPQRSSRTLALLRRNWPLLLALGVIAASAIWSIDPVLTLRRTIALFGTTAVGVLIYVEIGREKLLRFFAVYLATFAVGSVLLALGVPSLGTHVNDKFDGQWRGLTSFKNQAAWGAALFLLTWLGAKKTGWMRSWNYPLLAIGLLLLVQTGSATGLIAISFAIGAFVALALYRQYPIVRPIMIAALVMLAVIAAFDSQLMFESALDLLGRDASLTGRTSIWTALWPVVEGRPWLGTGYMVFWDHAVEYFGAGSWIGSLTHAHNAYIEILIDVGVLGLISQLLFLITALGRLFRLAVRGRDSDAAVMFVIFLTLAVIGIAGALFFRANTGIWVMTVALGCYATDRERADAPGIVR